MNGAAGDDWAIDVSHVTKRFRLAGTARSLKTAALDALRGRGGKTFTALDDVTFRVRRGETLGLIGANGAGKSTLLSIVAGTMRPTAGAARTRGTVSSLLELGAGFHPDLTGRENVMLYGAIMGIPRETMRARFDEIVDFAGLREFVEEPVRFYSSGMYVRLGFAVAVQVDPDVLLVDEVLAVGDAEFQRKCLDKMDEFRRAGKSMVLISHDINTIRRVSDRIAHLSHGRLAGLGDADSVVRGYQAESMGELAAAAGAREWGTGEMRFTSVRLADPATGAESADRAVLSGDRAVVRLRWRAEKRVERPVVGFSISRASDGAVVFGSNTQIAGRDIPFAEGDGGLDLELDLSNLAAGDWALSFALHSADHEKNWHRLENRLLLRLAAPRWFDGVARLPAVWKDPAP